jgi:2-polyprenyl-3-methyl-5-hydroxy-6-metoxy-1,4-benzoquinol methylase
MICPICNSEVFTQWGQVDAYKIMTCDSCGLGITSPFPTTSELSATNTDVYKLEERVHAYMTRKSYFEKRYREFLVNIKTFVPQGRLLDVGCNLGLFLKVAQSEGFEVTGVELNRECAEYGRTQFSITIHSSYLEELHFPDDSFDVITLFDVLEHVPDIHGLLCEVRRILRNNGLLVLQTPNLGSLMADLTKSGWNWLTPPDHLYHFTPQTILRLLHDTGFSAQILETWEPADEFASNVLAVWKSRHFLWKVLFAANKVSQIVTLLVALTHRLWWRKKRGGLLKAHALNCERM